jgi:hypothetical protein
MLVLAYDPLDLFPGAKVQFVQYDGPELGNDVRAEKTFTGNLITLLAELDSFLKGRFTQKPVVVSELREQAVFDYPPEAVREFLMNAGFTATTSPPRRRGFTSSVIASRFRIRAGFTARRRRRISRV